MAGVARSGLKDARQLTSYIGSKTRQQARGPSAAGVWRDTLGAVGGGGAEAHTGKDLCTMVCTRVAPSSKELAHTVLQHHMLLLLLVASSHIAIKFH